MVVFGFVTETGAGDLETGVRDPKTVPGEVVTI